jgi:hypothetical protein
MELEERRRGGDKKLNIKDIEYICSIWPRGDFMCPRSQRPAGICRMTLACLSTLLPEWGVLTVF